MGGGAIMNAGGVEGTDSGVVGADPVGVAWPEEFLRHPSPWHSDSAPRTPGLADPADSRRLGDAFGGRTLYM